MIPFCIGVLNGTQPASNPRRITRAVAVILLAHFLGDIHQPLHVGAAYFNKDKSLFEPTAQNHGFHTEGGNKLTLSLADGTTTNLHSYWDEAAVRKAFGSNPSATAAKMAASPPNGWKFPAKVDTWAVRIADEMMPTAREAHARLILTDISLPTSGRKINHGTAGENPDQPGYAAWCSAQVKTAVHKAGWRLAYILEEALK
jgi:hypothetical protein